MSSDLIEVVRRYWGFSSLRPLQEKAIRAALDGRDSLVVMPTGGGKSLCYQLPPLVRNDLTVVVSPLISLMKDQVDALRAVGVEARQIDSSLQPEEKRLVARELKSGRLSLLFVSPERIASEPFMELLEHARPTRFAIDEAHCISHWGHDFRPEYRRLADLRARFPDATMHAFTATATERVRADIVAQLDLADPEILVGDFDRPNLVYRVIPRRNSFSQVVQVLERHEGEGGIIYCIRRDDVDRLTERLRAKGFSAMPYHAGMTQEDRRTTHDAFSSESCDVVVATVAFGMGIDRSNIRFVVHAGLPKSVEHYQQETGRAGRDGLEAECVLLYSAADLFLWRSIIERPPVDGVIDPEFQRTALHHLDEMDRFARGAVCRHRALLEYFGQSCGDAPCGVCDLCLDETELVPEATVIAQKILSCVARTRERFGIGYVIGVLRGESERRIIANGHDRLSTWGLLAEHSTAELRDWLYQLLGNGLLDQSRGEYPTLQLNEASWEVMRGTKSVRLVRMARASGKTPKKASESWEGVDRNLFEELRMLRQRLAKKRGVPAYVVFGDVTLRELARRKPDTLASMREIYGIGETKLREYAPAFLDAIRAFSSDDTGKMPRP